MGRLVKEGGEASKGKVGRLVQGRSIGKVECREGEASVRKVGG